MREEFSNRLNAAMRAANMKQVDVIRAAARAGTRLGKSQVSQYVSGKTIPRRGVMRVLAEVLGVDTSWLAGEAAQPDPAITGEIQSGTGTTILKSEENERNGEAKPMRTFKKSSKLDNVLYDVRGPVFDEANRMEAEGVHILKLSIGNPAPFGFRTPDEVVQDMSSQLTETEG